MISYEEFMSDLSDVPMSHRRFLINMFDNYGTPYGGTDGANYFNARKKVTSQESEILMYQNLMYHLTRKGISVNFFFLKNFDNKDDIINIFFKTVDKIRSIDCHSPIRRNGYWMGEKAKFETENIDTIMDFFDTDEINILYVKNDEYMKNWGRVTEKLFDKYRGRYLVFFE